MDGNTTSDPLDGYGVWRDRFPVHPAAEMFDMMTEAALRERQAQLAQQAAERAFGNAGIDISGKFVDKVYNGSAWVPKP